MGRAVRGRQSCRSFPRGCLPVTHSPLAHCLLKTQPWWGGGGVATLAGAALGVEGKVTCSGFRWPCSSSVAPSGGRGTQVSWVAAVSGPRGRVPLLLVLASGRGRPAGLPCSPWASHTHTHLMQLMLCAAFILVSHPCVMPRTHTQLNTCSTPA